MVVSCLIKCALHGDTPARFLGAGALHEAHDNEAGTRVQRMMLLLAIKNIGHWTPLYERRSPSRNLLLLTVIDHAGRMNRRKLRNLRGAIHGSSSNTTFVVS